MSLALFDILTGRFLDGRAVAAVPVAEATVVSIRDNLERILAHRGAPLAHRQRGLPDLAEIFQGLPYSLARLVSGVQEAVADGEPRLTQLTVHPAPGGTTGPCLELDLAGRAASRLLRFRLAFQGGQPVAVRILAVRNDHA